MIAIIIIFLVILLVAGAGVGFYFYMKPSSTANGGDSTSPSSSSSTSYNESTTYDSNTTVEQKTDSSQSITQDDVDAALDEKVLNQDEKTTLDGDNAGEQLAEEAAKASENMSEAMKKCVEEADKSVKRYNDDVNRMENSPARHLMPWAKKFAEIYETFVNNIKYKTCKCFVDNIKKTRGRRKTVVCLTREFKSWEAFLDLLGFPCSLAGDDELYMLLKSQVPYSQRSLYPPVMFRDHLADLCKCLLERFKNEYTTPQELFNEFEWFVKTSNQQAMEEKIYKLVDETVDMCFKGKAICSSRTMEKLREYLQTNANKLWHNQECTLTPRAQDAPAASVEDSKTVTLEATMVSECKVVPLSDKEIQARIAAIENALIMVCNKTNMYVDGLRTMSRQLAREVNATGTIMRQDPFFKPLDVEEQPAEPFVSYPF